MAFYYGRARIADESLRGLYIGMVMDYIHPKLNRNRFFGSGRIYGLPGTRKKKLPRL
jgi:hypothetical protein